MDITDMCKLCEKVILTLETKNIVNNPLELPNTFDAEKKTYSWQFHEFIAYALIPRDIAGTKGRIAFVDMYLCIDEDDLDDIDVLGYVKKFFKEKILPKWANVRSVQFSKPVLDHSENIECRKMGVYQKVLHI